MRLLLLGCTGFVGKELVPTLLNENHEIYIVSRKPISKLKLDLDFNKFKFFQIDLSKEKNWNNENLLNILRETDGIINLMGEPIAEKKWTSEQKQEIENSRINTTKFMMKTLKDLKINPKVIINGSAIGYYGTSLSGEFTENSIGGKDFLANLCKKWEAVAAQKPFFSRLVIFRIGIVLEADGGALGKMLPIFKVGLGGSIGDGKQWMSWIHRTDLCALITQALVDKKYSGVFNAVAPNPVLMREFSQTLGKCLNRPAEKPFFSRLVIFRIGIVLEKDGGALGKMLPIFKVGLGGPIGDGKQWMSWIHRTDLCALIIQALVDKKYSGVFNAVAPNPVLMKEFSQTLGKCLNRPNLLPVPGAVLKILLGDGAKVVLEGQKVISSKIKNYNFKYPLLEKAIYASTKN